MAQKEFQPNRPCRTPQATYRLLLLVALLWVVTLSWFPFNAVDGFSAFGDALGEMLIPRLDWQSPLHALVWVGMGALAGLSFPWRAGRGAFMVGLAGFFGVCLVIEVVQAGVNDRHANIADMLVAVFAGGVGFKLVEAAGARLRNSPRLWWAMRRAAMPTALALSVAATGFALAIQVNDTAVNWDDRYPLLLGNERTGDRPWHGQMSLAAVYPYALSNEAVADLAATTDGASALNMRRSLGAVVCYVFDEATTLPNGGERDGRHAFVDAQRPIAGAVKDSGALSVEVRCAPATLEQSGPARIISLSGGTGERNFTLGQTGRDVSFRVRTPVTGENGMRGNEPQWANVFGDDRQWRHIVATWANAQLTLYVDGVKQPSIKLYTARMALGINYPMGDYIFVALVFLPLGLLARVAWDGSGRAITATLLAGVLPWALAGVTCGLIYGRPIEWGPLLFATVVGYLGARGMALTKKGLAADERG